jgi:hypothetical protein
LPLPDARENPGPSCVQIIHSRGQGGRDQATRSAAAASLQPWVARGGRSRKGGIVAVMSVAVSALSHIGVVRDHHEDSPVAGPQPLCATVTECPQTLFSRSALRLWWRLPTGSDPGNTGLGHRHEQVQRWNPLEGWVISRHPAYPALVNEAVRAGRQVGCAGRSRLRRGGARSRPAQPPDRRRLLVIPNEPR